MVIFHSYVSLPEGILMILLLKEKFNQVFVHIEV